LLKRGGWASILATYAFGVLGAAAVAKLIPLGFEFEQILGATPGQFAWLIALLGIPAALFAAISGGIVDRVGPRAVLVASGLIGVLVDIGYWLAPSMRYFQAARVIEGLALVGIFTAAPALLMATTEGRRRITAMTFWSTYTPTGFSLGLVLGGAFAGTSLWRLTFGIHGALMALATLAALALPRIPVTRSAGGASALDRLRDLAGAYRQGPTVQLAVAFFLMVSVGFGANTTLPSYVARVHAISVAAASNLVAGATLMMIVGAVVTGALLARDARPQSVMTGLAAGACLCGSALFWPGAPFSAVVPLLCLWFLFMGGATALLLAVLPLVAEPARRGAAAGLLNQSSALATLVTPPLWLALFAGGTWLPFVALVIGMWLVSTALLWALPAVSSRENANWSG
jgi:MFS family permease